MFEWQDKEEESSPILRLQKWQSVMPMPKVENLEVRYDETEVSSIQDTQVK